ncbi:MAG: FecR domain-containing protein [Pseudomonadota bacterium]
MPPLIAAAVPFPGGALAKDTTAAPEVGTTVSVKRRLTGLKGEVKRRLRKGARVHRDEVLQTSRKGRAEFKLDDDTRLALGANAKLKLDEFVLGQTQDGIATIALNFITGSFRFITGLQDSKAYQIKTPTATMGIRGTVLDVYVARNGETLVLLHEGEVEICSTTGTCRIHNTIGRIIHTTIAGVVSVPLKFSRKLIRGVSVGRAFPFVGRRLIIDPIRRLRRADIVVTPVKRAGKAVRDGTRTIRRTIRKISPFQ